MNTGDRFKVKDSGSEWLIFDTLSPAKRYIGVTTLVKCANQLQKMALRWEDRLKIVSEENTRLKEENAALIRENVELQATMVHPGDHMDALEELREAVVTDFAQRLRDQAAQHAEEVAELEAALNFWRGNGLLTVEEMQSEVF